MPLMKCVDCGKEHSDAAPACPNCGRPNPAPSAVPEVPKPAARPEPTKVSPGVAAVVILGAILFFTLMASNSRNPAPRPAPVPSEPERVVTPPPQTGPQLELVSWTWGKEYGYATVKGQVKNIADSPLRNVEAVVTFMDKQGGFITSDDALIDFNPILPGQTSPFSVMATWNPAMNKASVQFKELMGGTIEHRAR